MHILNRQTWTLINKKNNYCLSITLHIYFRSSDPIYMYIVMLYNCPHVPYVKMVLNK